MAFCIRNSFYYENGRWLNQAAKGVESIKVVTRSLNGGETLSNCKIAISEICAIGVCTKSQVYLQMAMGVRLRKDFSLCIFKALESQKEFEEGLTNE